MEIDWEEYIPEEGKPYSVGTEYQYSFFLKSRWISVVREIHYDSLWDLKGPKDWTIRFRRPVKR